MRLFAAPTSVLLSEGLELGLCGTRPKSEMPMSGTRAYLADTICASRGHEKTGIQHSFDLECLCWQHCSEDSPTRRKKYDATRRHVRLPQAGTHVVHRFPVPQELVVFLYQGKATVAVKRFFGSNHALASSVQPQPGALMCLSTKKGM